MTMKKYENSNLENGNDVNCNKIPKELRRGNESFNLSGYDIGKSMDSLACRIRNYMGKEVDFSKVPGADLIISNVLYLTPVKYDKPHMKLDFPEKVKKERLEYCIRKMPGGGIVAEDDTWQRIGDTIEIQELNDIIDMQFGGKWKSEIDEKLFSAQFDIDKIILNSDIIQRPILSAFADYSKNKVTFQKSEFIPESKKWTSDIGSVIENCKLPIECVLGFSKANEIREIKLAFEAFYNARKTFEYAWVA